MTEAADWTDWPLLQVRTGGTPDEEIPVLVWRTLRAALDRGEAFTAVVEMPGMSAASRKGRVRSAVERVRMVRELRPGLADRCLGLAFVMPADALRENAKAIKSATKIWGCPTTAVDNFPEGLTWARDRVPAAGTEAS